MTSFSFALGLGIGPNSGPPSAATDHVVLRGKHGDGTHAVLRAQASADTYANLSGKVS